MTDTTTAVPTVAARAKKIISLVSGVKAADLKPMDALRDDLGCDSLDAVEMAMLAEDEFSIEICDDDVESFLTVGDVISYLEKRVAG